MKALSDTDVPVPKMLHLCEHASVFGADFFIMSFVAGRTFWNPALPELPLESRAHCYDTINKTMAAIHSIDLEVAGLTDYVERYCERTGLSSIEHWNFYLVFSLFHMAAIDQGVKKRALTGNASASKDYALRVSALATPLANEAASLL